LARRPFDPQKHCGAVVERDPAKLRDKRDSLQRDIDELRATQQTRTLTPGELKRLGRRVRSVHFKDLTLRKIEEEGPDDRLCVMFKGARTDHPGTGLCAMHCACRGRVGGHLSLYSRRGLDKKLAQLIDELEASGMDLLDQTPELLMLRAKLKLYVDARQDFDPETIKSITILQEQIRKTIETVNNKKFQTMITKETLDLILFRMAEALMKYISDPEILQKISVEWERISVETNPKKRITSGNVEVST
jgi:hypothetical protein